MTINACVFDAYGTLFDVSAAAREAAEEPGRDALAACWQALAATWRDKQLAYSWLRAVTGEHADFWQVTGEALDYAMEAHGLGDPELRERLMTLYFELSAYPEVPSMLKALKAAGKTTAILSNGAPEMLLGAVTSAGIGDVLDAVISVEDVGVFKPDQRVYDLVETQAGRAAGGGALRVVQRLGCRRGSRLRLPIRMGQPRRAADGQAALAARPRARRSNAHPRACREALMPNFTASDGTRIHYRDEGEGLPVLCLAGLTRNASDFDYVAPHLTGCRLIRPDYRGAVALGWSGAETYTVPQEAKDQIELLDHLGLEAAAIIGTSRGGLIGMGLGAMQRERVLGLCLNDVGPALSRDGLERIFDYVGRNPAARTHADLAAALPGAMPGFDNVPPSRWLEEARKHYDETPKGLKINYDPALRQSFMAAFEGDLPESWPLFEKLEGLPLALIRGENSDLLTRETANRMREIHPDMVFAEVPDRAHIPFLDEPEALRALDQWLEKMR